MKYFFFTSFVLSCWYMGLFTFFYFFKIEQLTPMDAYGLVILNGTTFLTYLEARMMERER